VNKENDFIKCLTTKELATLWGPEATGKITTWNQVNPAFPAEKIKLYGPGTDSGTFDYFTDEINGEEGASRTDYEPSEDDNIIVQGVSGDKNALGYFGFTFFEENADKLKAVEIDNGAGCVAPSSETARDGSYAPLSRPLFIYVDKKAFASNAGAEVVRQLLHRERHRDRRGGSVHPAERRAEEDRSGRARRPRLRPAHHHHRSNSSCQP
jgi:phosphate transport system substrate-binding protein